MSLNSIEVSSSSAMELLNNTPSELKVVCPLVDPAVFEAEFGIDLTEIIGSVADEYDRLREEVTTQLDLGNNIVDRVESSLTTFESSVTTSEKYMWVIPALLFVVSVLAALSILGVVLAWRDRSGIRFQRFMSWGVLPLLIIVATSCWVVVLMASLGSMVGTGKWRVLSLLSAPHCVEMLYSLTTLKFHCIQISAYLVPRTAHRIRLSRK